MKLRQLQTVFFGLCGVVLIGTTLNIYSELGRKLSEILENQKRLTKPVGNFTLLRPSLRCPTVQKGDKSEPISKHSQRPIPKIIHQIWNDEIVPEEFVQNIRGLVRDNPAPEWKYYFWTKDAGLKMVQQMFPYLYKLADEASPLMRSDLFRYLVIYQYGGVYFDLDTVSVKPLHNFVNSHHCSVALEPAEHFFNVFGTDFLLTNGALFCVRRHPFYTHLIFHLTTTLRGNCLPFACTGPVMLSWLYRELNRTDNFDGELPDVQPSELFQDMYDHRLQGKRLQDNCYNNTKLQPHQVRSCANWIARGKEKRNLSEQALTYHTWTHTYAGGRLHFSEANHIKKVVPHAMIYGQDF